jgi:hypothetical protein
MSVADCLLDEPEMCEPHGYELPCWRCRLDRVNERAEERYQDRLDRREP